MNSRRGYNLFLFVLILLLMPAILPAGAQERQPASALPEILEFDRKLCPVCLEAELIIREVRGRFPGQFVVRKFYIDEDAHIFRRYKVAIVPTQIFLDAGGKEVFRHEGVFPREKLEQKLQALGFIRKTLPGTRK